MGFTFRNKTNAIRLNDKIIITTLVLVVDAKA